MEEMKSSLIEPGASALKEMHLALLQALRQREQEIFSYLTTLGLAFGGFGWLLLHESSKEPPATKIPFVFGTVGILVLLCLGSIYALALGYNYRYITFQLAKIEEFLKINHVILKGWPRSVEEFKKYTRWCDPPEIIKIFWVAFTVGILLVTIIAAEVSSMPVRVWLVGGICLLASALGPLYFGRRFKQLWGQEPKWSESPSEEGTKI